MRNRRLLRWLGVGLLGALPLALAWTIRERASWKPRTLETGLPAINQVSFINDGARLLALGSGAKRSQIQIWDVEQRKPVLAIMPPGRPNWLMMSPDDSLLVGSGSGSIPTVWMWDARNGHLARTLRQVENVWFEANGRSFYAVNAESHRSWHNAEPDVRRLDTRGGQVLEALDVQRPPERSFFDGWDRGSIACSMSPSNRFLSLRLWSKPPPSSTFTADLSGALLVDVRTGQQRLLPIPTAADCSPCSEFFSDDSSLLVVVTHRALPAPPVWSTMVWAWNTASGRLAWKWETPGKWEPRELTPDNARLQLWGQVGFEGEESPSLREARSGRLLADLKGQGGGGDWAQGLGDSVLSPDGSLLATGGSNLSDTRALLWDARTGKIARRLVGHRSPVTSLDWSADGATLATASLDGTVKLWRVR